MDQRLKANRSKQTAINIFSGILSLVVSTCISFFVSPYLVREVGVEASGFSQLANNFVTYASLITLAINSMGARFISIAYYKNDYEKCQKYYSSIFFANIAIMLVLIVPAAVLVFNVDCILNVAQANVLPVKIVFAISFTNFFVGLFNSCLSIPLNVLNKTSINNWISIGGSIFKIVFLLIVFFLLPAQIYYTALAGFIFAVICIPIHIIIKNKLFGNIRLNLKDFSILTILELVKSGIWNVINQCGNILMSGLDLLIANLFISGTEMGMLSVAKTIPLLIISLSTTINSNYSSKQIISYTVDNEEEFVESLENSCRIHCLILSVPISVFCVFSYSFFNIWQETLDPTKLAILSIFTIAHYIPVTDTVGLYNVLTAKNKLSVNAISYVITSLISFCVTFLLVKFTNFGVYAVAIVSSIFSILRNMFLMIPYYAKLLNKKWWYFYKNVLLSFFSFAVASFISSVFLMIIKPERWIFMFLAVGLSAIVSYAILYFVVLSKEQRLLFEGRIKKIWKK